jgi:hypothetical protein
MVLHANMSGALLVSISRAGERISPANHSISRAEIIDDLLVCLHERKGRGRGDLDRIARAGRSENVLVMLFSEDPDRWHAGSVQYTAIQATTEMKVQPAVAGGAVRRPGRVFTFQLGPVVPGRYFIAAVPSPDVMYPTERAILERLRPLAVPVTLVAGETVKIEVPVRR